MPLVMIYSGNNYNRNFSAMDIEIPAKDKALVPLDISISIPRGTYGRIAPRSGLAVKNFVDVGAGVIDYDYRGPVHVLLFNFSNQKFSVTKGDRIAQLIIEKIALPEVVIVDQLDDSERGAGGFGSTGIN